MRKWIPLEGIPNIIYSTAIIDRKWELCLEFSNKDYSRVMKVRFDGRVLSYRVTLKNCFLNSLSKMKKSGSYFEEWPLYISQETSYVNWFLHESEGIYSSDDFVHYIFITPYEAIDVLYNYSPAIEMSIYKSIEHADSFR